jgi:hypothetical protein
MRFKPFLEIEPWNHLVQSPSIDVVIESTSTDLEQGPSSIAGMGLGSVYAILGIFLFVYSLLRRGDQP